jgi:hypothetical protein
VFSGSGTTHSYAAAMDVQFSGEVWFWKGPSPFHYVTVPTQQSADIKAVSAGVTYGWGMVPVMACIGETEWTTSLFPKDGGYVLPLKDVVRTAEDIEVGHVVNVTLSIRL